MVKSGTRVLIYDSDERWTSAAKEVLNEEGFDVVVEMESFEACIQKVTEDLYLAAILNVQKISDPHKSLRRFIDASQATSIISIQDEPDPDLDDLLWYPEQLVHRPFGTKQDHHVTMLPNVVRHVLSMRGMLSRGIEVRLTDDVAKVLTGSALSWTGISTERGRGLSLQILTQELQIVVSQMFSTDAEPIAKKVTLEPFDGGGGHSGSSMFRVSPTILLQTERNTSAVLKFGPKEEMRTESKNYDRFVEWFLTTDQSVRKIGYAEGSYFAGIMYSYPRGSHGGYENFATFMRTASLERALAVIARMFRPSNRHWYSVDGSSFFDPESIRFEKYYVDHVLHASLYEMRNSHFKKLGEEIANIERSTQAMVWDLKPEKISFPALSLAIPNPISFLVQPHIEKVEMTVIHGDLHGHNIVVDESDRFFLLDFYYTGFGDICRDFVELELSVRYDLLCSRQLAPEDRYVATNNESVSFEGLKKLVRLERAIIKNTVMGEEVADPILSKEEPLQRCLELVRAIRAYAELNCKKDRRLYYMSLAVSALKGLKYFYPVDVKLYRLILSGLYVDLIEGGRIANGPMLGDYVSQYDQLADETAPAPRQR